MGSPLADSETSPVKFVRASVIVLVALPPAEKLTVLGEAAMLIAGAALTVTPMGAVALDTPAPLAVTVTVPAPSVAPALAVSVSVVVSVVPVSVAGANAAVTPVGSPLAASETSPVKFVRASVIVLVALPPAEKLTVLGEAAMLIAGAALTVTPMGAVALDTPAPLAVTVTVPAPSVAPALAVSVSVAVRVVPVSVGGANAAVTPVGSPLADSETSPVKFVRASVIRVVDEPPADTVVVAGVALMAIAGAALTVSPIVPEVLLTPAPVAVTVTVLAPSAAPAAAESVTTDVAVAPVTVAGANVAVTPVGRPLADRLTSPAKLVRTSVTVLVALPAGDTASVVGARLIAIVGTAVTVSCTVVVAVDTPAALPAIVKRYCPGTVLVATVTVRALVVAAAAMVAGANAAVTPVGFPVTTSATSPANPPVRNNVRAAEALLPACTLTAAGDADSAIAGVTPAVTVSVTVAVCEVTPVPLAVIVMGAVPTVAVEAAASVRVLVVEPVGIEAGAKVAVTPFGRPVTASDTALVYPPARVMVSATVVVAPCTTLAVAAPAVSVIAGVGAAVIVRLMATVCDVTPVPLAVIVMGAVPTVAFAEAVRVRVLAVAPLAIEAGAKLAVTPVGSPDTASVTASVKPLVRVMDRATVVLAPCTALAVVAAACNVMPGAGTVSEMAPEALETPLPDAEIAMEYVPGVVAGPTAMVATALVIPEVSDAGAKLTVMPLGGVPADRATVPV